MLRALTGSDIKLLQVFLAVVEAGGFSAAQIRLNISQSTISTQIADLEARLGLRLCRRGRSGFALTEDGRAVHDYAQVLFNSINAFTAQVAGRMGALVGEIRIGFADALIDNASFKLDQVVSRLRERNPDVSFNLRTDDPLSIEHGVLSDVYHFGVHVFPNHAPGLSYDNIFVEEQTLYCGALHPFFDRADDLTIEEIENEAYVKKGYYGGTLQTGRFRPKNPVAVANSIEATATLIFSGGFVGHLPTFWAERWVRTGKIRSLRRDLCSYTSQFEVVRRTGTPFSKLVEAFLNELRTVHEVTQVDT